MSSPPSQPPSTRSTPAPRARAGPRAGVTRKTKAERDKYAAEQAERDKKRTSTASVPSQTPGRGRGAARGARGGGLQRESSHADGTGLGVFGSAVGVGRSRDSKKGQQGQEEWLAGSAAKREDVQNQDAAAHATGASGAEGTKKNITVIPGPGGAADSSVPQKVVDNSIAIASDDDEAEGQRRDIERIWISSGDEATTEEDEVMTSKGKQRATSTKPKSTRRSKKSGGGGGLRPVRATRVHLENEVGGEEDGATAKVALSKRSKRESNTATSVPIVVDDDGDAMDIDTHDTSQPAAAAVAGGVGRDSTSSPELRKKSLAKRTTPRSKDARLHALETVEERAERLRVAEDSNRLLGIFGKDVAGGAGINGPVAVGTADVKGKDKLSAQQQLQEGRLFLMQFPPLTPLLIDPEMEAERAAAAAAAAATETATVNDPTSTGPSTSRGPPPGGITIKSDPDGHTLPNSKPHTLAHHSLSTTSQQTGLLTAPDLLPIYASTSASSSNPNNNSTAAGTQPQQPQQRTRLPAGKVGKLRIHASGKVTLDWGGVDMEVKMGTEVDFLQDAVLVDSEDVLRVESLRKTKSKGGNMGMRSSTSVGGGGADGADGDGDDDDADGDDGQWADAAALGRIDGDATATAAREDGDEQDVDGDEEGHHNAKARTSSKEGSNTDNDNHPGKVYALGQVTGKLVVVPDWGRLYD